MTFPTPFFCRLRDFRLSLGFLGVVLLMMAPMLVSLAPNASAQNTGSGSSSEGSIVIIPIQGTIEPGLGEFLDRAITEAEESGASMVILDINTPGGRLDTVLEMRDRILDSDVPIVAYVNREAFSAGALITIASDQIWMAPAAVFGAATPVDGATGATAGEKTVSAVRSIFRATAEEQGRNPLIAEAMVDPAVVVEGLDTSTSLLTLSVEQAGEHGYLDGIAADRDVLLEQLGLADASIIEAKMTFWERAVSVVTDPLVGSVLVLVGMGLIVADAFVAGFGIAAAVGALALGVFFWGYLLTGLAGWEDLLLIGIGLVLIALELFVIPGFGLAGIGGIVALIGGLVLTMTMRDFGDEGFASEAGDVLTTVAMTLSAIIVLLAAFLYLLPRLIPSHASVPRGLQRLSLGATVEQGGGEPLRPGWIVRLSGGGERVERDESGHTAMHIDHDRKYSSLENDGR
jgi:membrane-bound serine protease (ClpP class)